MKIKFSIISPIVFITIIVLIAACQKTDIYPIIPAIQYKNAQVSKNLNGRDSVIKLTISYTDGDGDLGLSQQMIDPPFDSSSIYYYNMYLYYYEFYNNVWKEVTTNPFSTDTIRYKYRFPVLTPNANNKAIKGDIEVSIEGLIPRYSNKIKFSIYIYDRMLHKSNVVESDAIIFNP